MCPPADRAVQGAEQSIWLTKPQSGADVIMEPIAENDDNKTLVQIDLKDTDFGPETVVSKGSYVLPHDCTFCHGG